MLAVLTESIDCDNGCDCMGLAPICPTGSILIESRVFVVVVLMGAVVTIAEFAEVVKFSTIDDGWLIAMTVETAAGVEELKLDDVLIDLICCCCCCWAAVAIKLGIWVGIVAVGDDAIIDLICVNAGDFAARGRGKVWWRICEGCGWWWNGASGWWWWWWCWKFATAAADWDANK